MNAQDALHALFLQWKKHDRDAAGARDELSGTWLRGIAHGYRLAIADLKEEHAKEQARLKK